MCKRPAAIPNCAPPPTAASRLSRPPPDPLISGLGLSRRDKRAENIRLRQRMPHAELKDGQERKLDPKMLLDPGPPTITMPANCSRTRSLRQTLATLQPTRNINSSSKS